MLPENEALRARIADFWAQLEGELTQLPPQRRDEFLLETRAHLEALVAARRTQGLNEEAAWQEAMEAFGDPREVGHALWEQWASSGRLESKGAPLSRRQLAMKFVRPLALGLAAYAALTLLNNRADMKTNAPIYGLLMVVFLGFGMYRFRRKGGQWTPSTIGAYVLMIVQFIWALVELQWGEQLRATAYGHWSDTWLAPTMMVLWGGWIWLYKRDTTKRPWQFAAMYKQSPVAAEQEYKLSPFIGLTLGILMGCISTISVGLQFFGLAQALWMCGGLILLAGLVGFWLKK